MQQVIALLCVSIALAVNDGPTDGVYTLRNVNSGLYLDVKDASGKLTTGETPDVAQSKWQFSRAGDGFYTLQNVHTGTYLSALPHETANGAGIALESVAGIAEARWRMQVVSNGDGTAYTLKNEAAGLFMSVKYASRSVGATVHLWSSPGKAESQWELSGAGVCHDAEQDDLCYHDLIWAKEHGIVTHGEWYPGLSNESSFADLQAHMHLCFWNRCPLPCAETSVHSCGIPNRVWDNRGCEDAVSGSTCHSEVTWAIQHGIYLHPEWYPNMTEHSSFRQFQSWLVHGQEAGLSWHSCQKPCCHDARPGELCHDDASWAQLVGINTPEYNDVYPSFLTNRSDVTEFQAYLHLCYPGRCPEPCASTEMMASQHDVSLDCPDRFNF